jgi:hypothetical protein
VPVHSVYHASECLFIQCLTYPSVWFPSVSHIEVLGVQVPECIAYPCVSHFQVLGVRVYRISKCLTYPNVWFPCVSHIRVCGFQVSHISECVVSKCLTYPSVWFPSVRVDRICCVDTHSPHSQHASLYIARMSRHILYQIILSTFSACITIYCISSYCPHGQHVSLFSAHVVSVSPI